MKFTIGLDFGTLSARGIVVRCSDGKIMQSAVREYKHGVMDKELCYNGSKLPQDWALQYPNDYLEVLEAIVLEIIEKSKVSADDIIGIGIDFTSCTMLPVDENAVPLCEKDEFKDRRNAYVKLWKHHGAQFYADKINNYLEKTGLDKTDRFGGKISSEILLPKTLEIIEEDYEIYEKAYEILEAGDWITRVLTDSNKRSLSMAGYKAWWNYEDGYPENDFFEAIDVRLSGYINDKLRGDVVGIGEKAGVLSYEWANKLGLKEGIVVAPTIIDSHAGVPGSGVSNKEQIMLVLGTSSVMIGLSEKLYSENGIVGTVKSGIVPGYYAYESGLACVGDLFGWFVENMVPYNYVKEANVRSIDIHQLLCEKASLVKPAESGLLVLDWWNGNKTPFVNGSLKGSILGLSLNTKPEEIYRAIIESTAFGTKMILDLYEKQGIVVKEIICSGGISIKNPFLMQIYADVLGKTLKIADCEQTAALGSAIYASLTAGSSLGGYDDYEIAVNSMSKLKKEIYTPKYENKEIYDNLYNLYKDYGKVIGEDSINILEQLSKLKLTRL